MFCRSIYILGLHKAASPCVELADKAVFGQVVRWRKRRWTKPSPSKMWFVPEKPVIPKEEKDRIDLLTSRYQKQMTAINLMFREEYKKGLEQNKALKRKEKEEDDAYRNQINENWNDETGKIREARLAKLRDEREEIKLRKLLEMEEEFEKQRQAAIALVEEAQRDAKHNITPENWDMEIEKVLNTRVNYNFSIDLDGNKYIEMPDGSVKLEKKSPDNSNTEIANSQ